MGRTNKHLFGKTSKFFGLSSTMVSNLGELKDLLYGTRIIGATSTPFFILFTIPVQMNVI